MGGKANVREIFTSNDHRYEILDTQIDHPDYDTLYLAWRTPLGRGHRSKVILKRLPKSKHLEQRERAWEEVQLASHLSHSKIAQVFGMAFRDEDIFVVMENMHGVYLLTAMDFAILSGEKLSPAFAAYVVAEVADALDYAHRRKDNGGNPLHIIHRAVSPVRIRLGFDGRIKLTNFGAAYSDLQSRRPTPKGLLKGDPAYCAPEVLRAAMNYVRGRPDPLISGAIDGRADVFSLGLILLEMLVAEYPLDPSDQHASKPPADFGQQIQSERPSWIDLDSLAFRVLHFTPTAVERLTKAVPPPLRDIICRSIQPTPAQRCWAGEMRDDLRAYLDTLPRPFNKYTLTEEITRISGKVITMEAIPAKPVERTALMPGGPGGSKR